MTDEAPCHVQLLHANLTLKASRLLCFRLCQRHKAKRQLKPGAWDSEEGTKIANISQQVAHALPEHGVMQHHPQRPTGQVVSNEVDDALV